MIYINIATNKYMNICVNNNLSYNYGDNEYLNKLLYRDVYPLQNTLKDFRFFDRDKNIEISNNMLKFYLNKKKQKKLVLLFEKYTFVRVVFINMRRNFNINDKTNINDKLIQDLCNYCL